MAWTLAQTKARVRALVDDPQIAWTQDSFIVPLLNQVYDDCNNQLTSTQSSYETSEVEVLDVTAGTPNLEQQQIGTGPLVHLAREPEQILWKPAGTDPTYYQLVQNNEILPDVQPQQGVGFWEWRSEVIWLSPSSIDVDLRVRGEFEPAPLSEDTDVLNTNPRIGYVVAYGTAALIGVVRGNTAWAQTYQQKAIEGLDEIMADMVRAEQGQTRRVKRQSGRYYGRDYVALNTTN